MKRIATLAVFFALAVTALVAQEAQSPEVQLKAAIYKEQAEGDLKAAAEQFKALSRSTNRAVAAQALVHLGQCLEKLGEAQGREATSAYERVVRDFKDQPDAVAEARRHLASRGTGTAADTGLVDRQVWTPPQWAVTQKPTPDGRALVFVEYDKKGKGQAVGVRDLLTGESRVVAQDTACLLAVPSPDGKQIACYWDDDNGGRGIDILPVNGSARRRLLESKEPIRPADWSPDGSQLLARITRNGGSDLALVSVADGATRVLKSRGGVGESRTTPRFSPDGRYVVHAAGRPAAEGSRPSTTLHLLSLDGGNETTIIPGAPAENDWNPVWTPDGHRVIFLSDRAGQTAVWAVRIADGKPQGDPEMLKTEDGATVLLGMGRDGTLYCERYSSSIDVYQVELDPSTAKPLSEPKRVNQSYVGRSKGPQAWSPDGKWLAFTRHAVTGTAVVLHAMDTGKERELPGLPGVVGWFPDGRSVLAGPPYCRVNVDTGQSQPLPGLEQARPGVFGTAITLSHDGKHVFYSVSDNNPATDTGLYTVRLLRHGLETGEEREVYRTMSTDSALHSLRASPDDRFLAFGERTAAASLVKVVSVDGGAAREVYRRSAWGVEWSRDGSSLLARGTEEGTVQLVLVSLDGGPVRATGLKLGVQLALAPDGRRLAMTWGVDASGIFAVKNLLAASKTTR